MKEPRRYKIWYKNSYPGSPNPGEIKEDIIETTEDKERLLQHAHIVKVEAIRGRVAQKKTVEQVEKKVVSKK